MKCMFHDGRPSSVRWRFDFMGEVEMCSGCALKVLATSPALEWLWRYGDYDSMYMHLPEFRADGSLSV